MAVLEFCGFFSQAWIDRSYANQVISHHRTQKKIHPLTMEYIILEAGGKQYWAESGKFLEVRGLNLKSGTKLLVRRVLFGRTNDEILIGKPYLSQLKVEATVGKHFLGSKVFVYKMKPKKKYRRKNGHRQQLCRLHLEKITSI